MAGERVRAELKKLLGAADPVPVVRLMIEDRVLGYLLPAPATPERLAALVRLEPAGDPVRRLAALLPPGDAGPVAETLRLSVKERERLLDLTGRLAAPPPGADDRTQRLELYRLGPERYRDLALLAAAAGGDAGRLAALLAVADAWTDTALPSPAPMPWRWAWRRASASARCCARSRAGGSKPISGPDDRNAWRSCGA